MLNYATDFGSGPSKIGTEMSFIVFYSAQSLIYIIWISVKLAWTHVEKK